MTKVLQAASFSQMLAPSAAATTVRTATLDTTGADYATIVVNFGIELNTNSTNVVVSISEGDTTNSFSTFNSDFNSITVDNVAATIATRHIDLKGRKRYLLLTVTPDSTTNGPVITSATGIMLKDRSPSSAATNSVAG